jgi:hypothetical protein
MILLHNQSRNIGSTRNSKVCVDSAPQISADRKRLTHSISEHASHPGFERPLPARLHLRNSLNSADS